MILTSGKSWAEFPNDLKAVLFRHLDVRDHKVLGLVPVDADTGIPIRGLRHLVTGILQGPPEDTTHQALIVDDQDVCQFQIPSMMTEEQ